MRKKGWILFDIELEDQDTAIKLPAQVRVSYVYHPACPGQREAGGVPIEPDEPAHVEIDRVTLEAEHGGWCKKLAPEQYDRADIERRCMEDAES